MSGELAGVMDQRLAQLKKAEQRFDKMNPNSIPKIQRVPVVLRQNDGFAKYCSPKMISFGPIHHDNENLKQGEHYKLLWTSKFVASYNENLDADQAAQDLLGKIEDNIEELKNEFAEDAISEGGYDDNCLGWMLFVDGCSLLHFMENVDEECPEALNLKLDQLLYIWRDMRLLENQLPRRLLEMLSKKEGADLEYLFSNHSTLGESKRKGLVRGSVQNPKPIHILDFARSEYLSPQKVSINIGTYSQIEINTIPNQQDDGDQHNNQTDDVPSWNTYKNIRDLKNAGIRVMPYKDDDAWTWSNIHFTSKWFSGT